jgi:YgiT-type zinc finger domain-containing protein
MTRTPTTSGPRCPECGHGVLVPFTRDEEFDHDLGDRTIKVVARAVPVERCEKCGLVASGSAAAKVRHNAVCRAAGFPTPSEQKSIRDELGWSQQYLADLTGYGIATVNRSERGRLLANRSYYKTLLAIRDCPPYREYLERQQQSGSEKREPDPALGNGSALAPDEQAQAKSASGAGGSFKSRFRSLVPSGVQIEHNKIGRPPRTRAA